MRLRRRTLVHRWVKACTRNKWLGYSIGGWSETSPTVESVPEFGREKVEKTNVYRVSRDRFPVKGGCSSLKESTDSVERFRHMQAPHTLYSHGVG
ncbi:hypothetical protein CsSME_00052484 [Camellia sinensis var. sinensis]